MDLSEKVLKLTTVALGIKGKTLRLQGAEFHIGMCAVTCDGQSHAPKMTLELFLAEDMEPNPDCTCDTCIASRSMKGPISIIVSELLIKGRSAKLVLDSCGAAQDGFTAKVRNTATRRCDVGEGATMVLAVAHATAKSCRE